MANRPTGRKVSYSARKQTVKKTEPYYDPFFANRLGPKEPQRVLTSRGSENWKETPKWQRVTVPLKPKYYTSKKRR